MKLPDDMSTNDHTHTADCDAHGCAYKEPAAEQGVIPTEATCPVVPAPAAAPDAQTLEIDAFLFFNPVIDDDGPVESNLQEFIDFARSLEREAADLRRQLDERERDAAADLAREEMATICERRSAFWGSVKDYRNEAAALDCSRAIRASITDPAAVKKTLEDAARYREARRNPTGYVHLLNLMVRENATGEALDKMMDRIAASRANATRKGEEG